MKLDPITVEIMQRKFIAVLDELYYSIQHSSRSSFVKEAADFAIAFLDVEGNVFAYPGVATFSFLIDCDFKSAIDAVPDLKPGDVIFSNDPYTSKLSTHLPDLQVIAPYFHDGEIVCYCWAFVHCADLAGALPSSMSPTFTDIHQEGLRIPPLKIVKEGKDNEDILAVLRVNSRMADQVIGDLQAMLGTLKTGERRVAELIARHGAQTFIDAQQDVQDYSAAIARDVLRRLPDGVYEFWDYIDDDLVSSIPLRVRARVTTKDGGVHLDVSGSDLQAPNSYNVSTHRKRMFWLTNRLTSVVTTYGEHILHNAGVFRSMTVTVPEVSVFNAQYPDAVSMRSIAPRRLFDAITGALLKAAPDFLPAPSGGTFITVSFAERAPDGVSEIVEVLEPVRSGAGALKGQDGTDAREMNINNMRNHPLELVETLSSVRVLDYDIAIDSGGPGKWRGGVGQRMCVQALRDGMLMVRGLDRMLFPPWGVANGKAGGRLSIMLETAADGARRRLFKADNLPVRKGDVLTVEMPGGGGFGNPFERDPERVRDDVLRGFVSAEAAARDYGVVTDGRAIDAAATEARRAREKIAQGSDGFDFGPERTAYEAVFTDAALRELNERLLTIPKAARTAVRRAIFEKAAPGISRATHDRFLSLLEEPAEAKRRLRAALDDFDRIASSLSDSAAAVH